MKRYKEYVIILIVTLIISLPLLKSNLNIYRDDGIQHVLRLAGTLDSIKTRQIFPVIMSNFCNGFGYSWNLFYSPATAYAPLVFRLITSSYEVCFKLFMTFTLFLSGLFMYKFIFQITKKREVALIGSIIYIIAPYRMTDMYTRVAISEHTAFIFLPMIFMGLDNIIKQQKGTYYLTIGAIGLILTHSISTFIVIIFAFIYLIINIKKVANKKIILKLVISAIFILLITSFYTVPMLEHKAATEYEVFIKNRMGSVEKISQNALSIGDLLITKDEELPVRIGFLILIPLAFTPMCIKHVCDKKTYITFLCFGCVSIFMCLNIFPWKYMPEMFGVIQFSFRMLEFVIFFLSVIVAINFSMFVKKISVVAIAIIFVVAMFSLVSFKIYYDKKDIQLVPRKVTGSKERVNAGCASFEYLPKKAYENRDYIATRENRIYVLDEENSIIELPYIYYLGYNIKVSGEKVSYFETVNGFIGINVGADDPVRPEEHISVEYTGTALMKITAIISFVSLIIFIVYDIYGGRKK